MFSLSNAFPSSVLNKSRNLVDNMFCFSKTLFLLLQNFFQWLVYQYLLKKVDYEQK